MRNEVPLALISLDVLVLIDTTWEKGDQKTQLLKERTQ